MRPLDELKLIYHLGTTLQVCDCLPDEPPCKGATHEIVDLGPPLSPEEVAFLLNAEFERSGFIPVKPVKSFSQTGIDAIDERVERWHRAADAEAVRLYKEKKRSAYKIAIAMSTEVVCLDPQHKNGHIHKEHEHRFWQPVGGEKPVACITLYSYLSKSPVFRPSTT